MRSVPLAIHGVYIPYKQARMAPGRDMGKVPDQARAYCLAEDANGTAAMHPLPAGPPPTAQSHALPRLQRASAEAE